MRRAAEVGMRGKESGGGNRIADIRNAFFPSAGADSDDEDLAVGFTPRVCVDSQCSACRGRREQDYNKRVDETVERNMTFAVLMKQ